MRGVYKAYQFRDHDPVIDKISTIIEDENVSIGKVSALSGVSSTTLYNWDKRKTKRPQFCCVMAVARSLGYDVQLVPANKSAKAGVTIGKRNIQRRRTNSVELTH